MGKLTQNKVQLTVARVLERQEDGLTKTGDVQFVEFDDNGFGKKLHSNPEVGFSCIVNPHFGISYTWMTSVIIEVISDTEFKTKNSHYKILKNEQD